MNVWTFNDIPDQTGGTAIGTGANTGIGLETAPWAADGIPKGAKDEAVAARRWEVSEEPTGVPFPLAATAPRQAAA